MVHDYLIRQAKLELARREFFYFSSLLASDFYKEDRMYLKTLCNTLQALYEGRIVKIVPCIEWQIVDKLPEHRKYTVCKKLMLNMPPQHGKSRTLINFCCWVFGNNPNEKIITASYNDNTASDFSRYTRDEISQSKNDISDIVYSDVFPNTKIKRGNASFEKWALEGQHFSYLGAGIGGSITSKGASILIVDDPIKGSEEAFNENHLDKVWSWYTNTFRSRVSAPGGEPIEIVNMTRWSDGDICGRLLESHEKNEWYVLKFEAYNEKTDTMLCPEIFSKKRYLDQKSILDLVIFMANYHQQPVNMQGKLYKYFKTYDRIPKDDDGNPLFEKIKAYIDTADEGDDYLCGYVYGVYNKEAYLLDVIFTKEAMEITEPATARMLFSNKVNDALIESNNGGRGFARAVERILKEELKSNYTFVDWFHQSKQKKARILTNSTWVMEHIYFPSNWKDRWPDLYKDLNKYQREGKNKHDDAEDAITGVAEYCNDDAGMEVFK